MQKNNDIACSRTIARESGKELDCAIWSQHCTPVTKLQWNWISKLIYIVSIHRTSVYNIPE